MSRTKLVVVGSSNMDMVVKVDRIPRGGETMLGGDFIMVPGGKGANQAVCAARLGAQVKLVARVGRDVFGEKSVDNLRAMGVDTEFVTEDHEAASGVALIAVDAQAENAIVVAPGANDTLSPSDVDRAKQAIADADAVVLQLEIPLETVLHTIDLACSVGTRVILNPAPMRPVPREALGSVSVLVPNQHEAAGLVGHPGEGAELDAVAAAKELLATGAQSVVITLGSKGCYVASKGKDELVPALQVGAVDTTAAGDAFTGALACSLVEGRSIFEAARFAARVAAISVTRLGAQSSMPTRDEVESFTFGN